MIEPLYIMIVAYLAGALTFFIYMFLHVGPEKSTKLIKTLLNDPDFVEETSSLWRGLLLKQIKNEVIPLIISGIASTISLDDETIVDLKKQLSHAVMKEWNAWFARQSKSMQKIEDKEMEDSGEIAQYITMNADRPDAISAISTAISAKSPVLGAALQYLSQQQTNSTRSRNTESKGGY